MFLIFAVIVGGIVVGRLLPAGRTGGVSRLITGIIWLLLLLLGMEVGSDPAVVNGLATLGRDAFVVFAGAVAGSVCMAWLLGRRIGRSAEPTRIPEGQAACGGAAACSSEQVSLSGNVPEERRAGAEPVSLWHALRGSLVIVAFFAAGCLAGLFSFVPFDVAESRASTYVLYALMGCVGVTLGNDRSLAGRVRSLDRRLALLPVATAAGTLLGAVAVTPLLPFGASDALAVGAGFGYYSLSGIFIADLRGAELGTVALLCNVLREIFTLLAAPLVARWAGPLAAVSIGGATTFDTTLPVITRAAGAPYAVVAIFHGCMLDFSVPFLVTFFCSL